MKVFNLIISVIMCIASVVAFSLLSVAKQWAAMGVVGVCLVGAMFATFLSIVDLFKEDIKNGRD